MHTPSLSLCELRLQDLGLESVRLWYLGLESVRLRDLGLVVLIHTGKLGVFIIQT